MSENDNTVEEFPVRGMSVWEIVYLAGVLAGLSFFVFTYLRSYREFCTSLPAEHEYVHIQRWDGAVKIILAVTLCLHWFNPSVWGMYILFNRDMELSCDETVVRRFGEGVKSAYARMLITLEERKSGLMPFYSSFSKNTGKNAIEERITAIMKIKKKSLTSVFAAVVLTVGVGGVFATSAAPENREKEMNIISTDIVSINIDETEESTAFDFVGTTWEEVLSPYEPFGLTWEYRPDDSGNGLKMHYNGKEVRGIWDQEKKIWITEHTGISAYAEDAVELSAVYKDGVLSGIEEISGEEGREWDELRKANSARAALIKAAGQEEMQWDTEACEEEEGYGPVTLFLCKPYDEEREGSASCDLRYFLQLQYRISDRENMTIGERDTYIRNITEEIRRFWAETDPDTLLSMTEEEMIAVITEIAATYSDSRITVSIDPAQVSFEKLDERS